MSGTEELSPEDRLWIAILMKDEILMTMDDGFATWRLREGDFPERIIQAYLKERNQ